MEKLVYGPVPSRRFGLSLGVDVVPFKVCTLDCTYCQLGHTTRHSARLEMFAPVARVVAQVVEALQRGPRPDVITFAGSGEPTLYAGLGDLADELRATFAIPLLLITNGTLLWKPSVAAAAARFDLVAPSLDAGDEETFNLLNRPAPGITFQRLLDGLGSFIAAYPQKVRLEVFFVAGVNDSPAQLDALVRTVDAIAAPRVELNTAVRPTADPTVRGVSAAFLAAAAPRFPCPAIPIAAPPEAPVHALPHSNGDASLRILTTLARRPCTAAHLSASLAFPLAQVEATLQALQAAGKIAAEARTNELYYVLRP